MIEEPQAFKTNKKKLKEFIVDESIISKIKDLSNLGLENNQIGDYFGLDEHEWFLKTSEYPEIKEAVMIGRSRGVMNSALKLREHINKGNLKATTFYLETKGGFNKPDPKLQEPPKNNDNEKITDRIKGITDPIEASRVYQELVTRSYK